MIRGLALLLVLAAHTSVALAQPPAPPTPEARPGRVAVFLDCRTHCDFDFIREQITFVDWVRDRTTSDVHVLVTEQSAGAGWSEYTLAFLGQRAAARVDTLRFTTNPTTTFDEQRRELAQTISAGLVPYVVRAGSARLLRITAAEGAAAQAPAAPTNDPWRAWVFELGVNGGLNGEAQYKSKRLSGSFEAERVTEEWKSGFELDYNYNENRITDNEYDDNGVLTGSTTYYNLQRNWEANSMLVKSLGAHLSAGARATLRSNTFRNIQRALEIGTALEYNLFPYSQSTRREFVFQYGVGYEINRYVDTTIFDRMRETLPVHFILANYETRQEWGSAELRAEHRNYLTDAAKRNSSVGGHMNIRLFRGLSLNMGGGYSWIRDQVTLRKGGGDQADVLLRRRELLTGYEYNFNAGLRYTFGSIFNNVVNPRF